MDCIAHRGFAGLYPENTLAAVRAASRTADAVEVDVRRCGSGELVVHHDETVDRVTDGTGAVGDLTAADLGALSVAGPPDGPDGDGTGAAWRGDCADVGVPTLAEVFAALPGGVTCHAELKERDLGDDLAALAADADCPVVASSFDAAAVAAVESLPTALITAERAGAVERAAATGCVAVHPHVDAVDDAFVAAAHDAGLAVNAWTVTDPGEVRRLRDRGVDGVIADYPSCCPGRA